MEINIDKKTIGFNHPCFIIAEIGLNHNGDLELAKTMIDTAKNAGADAVKFQKRTTEDLLIKSALDAPYEKPYAFGDTYRDHRDALEFSNSEFVKLQEYANKKDIIFFASPWDENSADFLDEINVPVFKMASADLTNLPLLEHVAKKGKPVIISTGMSTMDEIIEAVNTIAKYNPELIILSCVSTYPSKPKEINLRNIEMLKRTFDEPIGYSGHENGIAISLAAVALGACVVERHFTMDKTLKGPDHAASLEPQDLEKLVRDIRIIEQAFGTTDKKIQEREKEIRIKLSKSVVSKKDIKWGELITKNMLTIKGPGTGLSPKYIYTLPGKKALVDIPKDVIICSKMIKEYYWII